jgi:hypothetical protein
VIKHPTKSLVYIALSGKEIQIWRIPKEDDIINRTGTLKDGLQMEKTWPSQTESLYAHKNYLYSTHYRFGVIVYKL